MSYIKAIAELCKAEVTEIQYLSQKKIVDEYILPRAVHMTGDEERGAYISDDFMHFMSMYGDTCFLLDQASGEALYELAMQRISCGAVRHKFHSIPLDKVLPPKYLRYAAWKDKVMPMSLECWEFLHKQLHFIISDRRLREHAVAILLGILDTINSSERLPDGYLLPIDHFTPDPRDMFAWAKKIVSDYDIRLKHVFFGYFSQPDKWQHYLWFWHQKWPEFNKEEKKLFFKNIGVSSFWGKYRVVKKVKNFES